MSFGGKQNLETGYRDLHCAAHLAQCRHLCALTLNLELVMYFVGSLVVALGWHQDQAPILGSVSSTVQEHLV